MRIGILGYGSIGSRHGRNLVSLGHKVIFHDPNVADGLPKDEVIKRSDAVVIASPTSEHASDISLCKRENKPCFAEKPIADSFIKEWSTFLKWPLMVGYNLRFHPCVRKAKEWLNDDRLGTPYWANFICAQFNDKPEYLRDGVTLNWSHEIDLALHLLGPAGVSGASITKDDAISDILLTHTANQGEHGCRTAIHLDYVTRPEHRGFSVCGPKGVMVANIPARSIALLDTDGTPKHVEQYQGSFDHDYVAEMAAFIQIVEAHREGFPLQEGCTAEEAIDVLRVCLKAKKEAGL